jgi:mono/diheme cytochrome c family protein
VDTLKIIPFAVAIGLLGLVASAQEAKPQGALTGNPVYQKNCAKCHGKTAQGRFMAGPSLVSEKATSLTTDELQSIISHGKHRMPKFEGKLQPSEIDALVRQIQSQSKQK